MNNKEFFRWCANAVRKIKYRRDRDEVHKELYAHLEDCYDAYIAKGFSHYEAEKKALCSMGDSDDIAVQLATIHRSILPYVLIVTRCIVAVLMVALLVQVFPYFSQLYISRDKIMTECGYEPYIDTVCTKPGYEAQQIFCEERSAEIELDDYHIRIKNIALWRRLDEEQYAFHIEINVFNYRPWASNPKMMDKIWARDNLGNTYACYNVFPIVTDSFVAVREERIGVFTYRYDLQLVDFVMDRVQWIELCYDHDGRNIVQRIYLRESEEIK